MKKFLVFLLLSASINLGAQCPTSLFTLTPSTGCALPHSVFFTDQSTTPDTWFWEFGDGGTSTSQNPVHNYTTTGGFEVTLTVGDTISGCTDVFSDSVKIGVPTATIPGLGMFGCSPLTANFTETSSNSGYGILTNWAWDFGDGSTSSLQNPSYIYNIPGVYTVTLTVTNSLGCTDIQTSTNYVQVIGPDVNFGSADTIASCPPHSVSFTDSTLFGAPIIGWSWDFGDGNSSNLQNPTNIYSDTGSYSVSLTVSDIDGCSKTLTFTDYVTIYDNTPPTISCPANQSANLDANCQYILADYTSLATAADNCSFVVSQTPAPGTVLSTTQTVTLTATDDYNNITNCTFDVIPADITPPTISCPGNQNVSFDANCQYLLLDYTGLATVNDNCSATVTQSPSVGTAITTTQTITLTATDGALNTTTCTFDVIPTDDTAPAIVCPSSQSVNLDATCQFTLLDYTVMATANDNCTFTVSQSPAIGSSITTTQTITLTITDGAANSAICTFDINPLDVDDPIITCPGDITQNNDPGSCGALITYSTPVFSDNCSAATLSQTLGLVSTDLFPIGVTTNTFNVTDNGGNTANCSFSITITDTESPTIICPDTIQTCDSIIIFSDPVLDDNCLGTVLNLTSGLPSGTLFPLGMTTNNYTITDASGNSASCSFELIRFVQPSVDAGTDILIDAGASVTLNPTSTNASIFDWSPSTALDDPSIENPVSTPTENTTYTLTVTLSRSIHQSRYTGEAH